MLNCKYVNYPEIGNVFFEKSKKAKRIIISVKSPSSIRVAVPRYISFRKAKALLHQKLDWIKKQQNNYSKIINASELVKSASAREKSELINRVIHLAEKYGFTHRKITIRTMKTRWGSCSAQNNISINVGLIALSDELRDYVILHELVHTKIKNHSKEFWKALELIIKDPRSLNRKLKQNYGLYDV
jgi:predicted metal-dependent hydrolase